VERALPRVPPGPPVRLRLSETFAAQWLPASAADLSRKLEDVTLELVTGRSSQEVDLEVTARRPPAHGQPPRELGLAADALYASEAYLLDHGRPAHTDALVGHRVVLLIGAQARTDAGRWLHAAVRTGARVALRTDSVPVYLSAVQAGVGLGVLPVGSEELAPELLRVHALPHLPPRPLYLVFRREGRPSPRIRRAAQVLEHALGAALRRWERHA
jgi:DNA-binding transcriptional LysR family regulator